MDADFAIALQHHQAGRLREAELLYRQILARNPRHPESLHYLGALAHQAGNNAAAVELIQQATLIAPTYAEAWGNLGHVFGHMGRYPEATAAYEKAAALQPTVPEHGYALGLMRARCRHYSAARDAFKRAIELRADYAEAYCDLADALGNLGDFDGALAALHRALALKPHFAAALCNLGNELCRRRQFAEARAAVERALAIDPGMATAYGILGRVHAHRGEIDAALAATRRAVELDPQLAFAYGVLAQLHLARGEADLALQARRRELELEPGDAGVHSAVIFTMLCHPAVGRNEMEQELARWEVRHAKPLQRHWRPHENHRDPERRLRVGYVSADFWEHVAARFHMPLIEHHDPQQVEVFCYAQEVCVDDVTRQLQQRVPGWRNIAGMTDEQAAEQIRADRIDVLVDLQLHTAHNRLSLFARKPAPVQVTWLGYPGSTGMHAMDYRLTDPYLDAPEPTAYAERTHMLPHTFLCYPRQTEPAVSSLPAILRGQITFGCLHSFRKVNADVLRLWARVLVANPGSRLLLVAPFGSHRQQTQALLASAGVAPERVEFNLPARREAYLRMFHDVDITLDTFPWNGYTSGLDSLWMGVPLVTLVGDLPQQRAGLSQLTNIGLSQLAVRTADAYVAVATTLAENVRHLAALRGELRLRMLQSPLTDVAQFTRDMEAAYRGMWRKWCGGN